MIMVWVRKPGKHDLTWQLSRTSQPANQPTNYAWCFSPASIDSTPATCWLCGLVVVVVVAPRFLSHTQNKQTHRLSAHLLPILTTYKCIKPYRCTKLHHSIFFLPFFFHFYSFYIFFFKPSFQQLAFYHFPSLEI